MQTPTVARPQAVSRLQVCVSTEVMSILLLPSSLMSTLLINSTGLESQYLTSDCVALMPGL